jgi:hypothetical protein
LNGSLHGFCLCGKFAQALPTQRFVRQPVGGRARRAGENSIEKGGFAGPFRSLGPALVRALLLVALAAAGCGGEEEATVPVLNETTGTQQAGQGGTTSSAAPGGNTAGGSTVEADAQAESLSDTPFVLNADQPIPPDFRAAYQRQALIVVEFFKEGADPFYPQGLEVDDFVNEDLDALQSEYPEVEYFTYDISDPGTAETSEELERGQYGTLAAQLDVGFTPFIAMLAPRGEQYVIENLFQGYVEEGVLSQALFDLSNTDVQGNSSDIELELDQIELTESGGGIEYFTVTNNGEQRVVLEGFTLRVMDPETGEVSDESEGFQVNEGIRVGTGRTISVGRVPDITDADGRTVKGTFAGGGELGLEAGQQVAILDSGGAVVDTITV